MNIDKVPALVLRAPHGPEVAHLVLRVPKGLNSGHRAAQLLKTIQRAVSFGPQQGDTDFLSIGFSFAGLHALGLPTEYARVFRRLAPAFAEGAALREARRGEGVPAPTVPVWPELEHANAHLLLSWHGLPGAAVHRARQFAAAWAQEFPDSATAPRIGRRLGAPGRQAGEWVHFGFRDGLSEVCIDSASPRPEAPDCRMHKPGALVLGGIDDEGCNPFALSQAPDKVRSFFADSSFGVLHPVQQDTVAFERQVDRWFGELGPVYGNTITRDFVKAKLCGRWPDGRVMSPGDLAPQSGFVMKLKDDPAGQGCPFGSHVRRMQAAPDGHDHVLQRPLQRRGVPYGDADWIGDPKLDPDRGLIGHFFCASIEDQFEHLLGGWSARPPLGMAPDDQASDPLVGPHGDPDTALLIPLQGRPTQRLKGFASWTTPLGTLYAWYPSCLGLNQLLEDDFAPDHEGPWL